MMHWGSLQIYLHCKNQILWPFWESEQSVQEYLVFGRGMMHFVAGVIKTQKRKEKQEVCCPSVFGECVKNLQCRTCSWSYWRGQWCVYQPSDNHRHLKIELQLSSEGFDWKMHEVWIPSTQAGAFSREFLAENDYPKQELTKADCGWEKWNLNLQAKFEFLWNSIIFLVLRCQRACLQNAVWPSQCCLWSLVHIWRPHFWKNQDKHRCGFLASVSVCFSEIHHKENYPYHLQVSLSIHTRNTGRLQKLKRRCQILFEERYKFVLSQYSEVFGYFNTDGCANGRHVERDSQTEGQDRQTCDHCKQCHQDEKSAVHFATWNIQDKSWTLWGLYFCAKQHRVATIMKLTLREGEGKV